MQEIRGLLLFAAILEKGSIQGAADSFGISASAVSQQLSKLEESHRVKLLNRSTRRLEPTEAGRQLAAQCARLAQTAREALQTLENIRSDASGDVRLALPTGLLMNGPLRAALGEIQTKYPAINLKIQASDRLQDLWGDHIDLAIRSGPISDDQLIARPLTHSTWSICASPAFLNGRSFSEPAQLQGLPWIYGEAQPLTLCRGAASFTLAIGPGISCNQFSGIYQLCRGGLGLALLPQCDAQEDLDRGHLQQLLPDWQLPPLVLQLVSTHRVQAKRVALVLECLRRHFGQE